MKWAYGITTVPERLNNGLFEKTFRSLEQAGFKEPRLFVDGGFVAEDGYSFIDAPVTAREDRIRAYGNWLLGLIELYIRNPLADRFALFQDDLVTCKGLKDYLSAVPYPEKGYLNLYTFPHNQPDQLRDREEDGVKTHPNLNPNHTGFYLSDQWGKGAVSLVFDLEALMTLFSQMSIYVHAQDIHRGHKRIDGAVVDAMKSAGFKEYVHNPSLVQHTGAVSSIGVSEEQPKHPLANSFQGENWDARTLL